MTRQRGTAWRCFGRWFGVALLLCAACGSEQREPETDASGWLDRVRSAHVAADAALQAAQPARAIEVLSSALDASVPREIKAEDRRVVHQDLLFQIAEIELRAAHREQALVAADRGLGLGAGRDLFTANLLVARGEALEALARDTEAAASYYEALDINRELLRTALAHPEAEVP